VESRAREATPPRPADPVAPPAALPPAAPARDISLRLSGPGERVEVRVVERGGEIHVAVRTADPELARTLRQDLPELSTRLEREGLRAESWHPAAAAANRAEGGDLRGDARGGGFPQPGQPGGQQQREERRQPPLEPAAEGDAASREPEDFAGLVSESN
jgi:hypothetical protein